jgi:membrane protease YdiL (CAAX protease family)
LHKETILERVSTIKNVIIFLIFAAVITLTQNMGYVVFISSFIAALINEVIFRAWLFQELGRYNIKHIWIILISAIFFSLVHIPAASESVVIAVFIRQFIVGLVCAVVYYRTKNIANSIFAHTVMDLI